MLKDTWPPLTTQCTVLLPRRLTPAIFFPFHFLIFLCVIIMYIYREVQNRTPPQVWKHVNVIVINITISITPEILSGSLFQAVKLGIFMASSSFSCGRGVTPMLVAAMVVLVLLPMGCYSCPSQVKEGVKVGQPEEASESWTEWATDKLSQKLGLKQDQPAAARETAKQASHSAEETAQKSKETAEKAASGAGEYGAEKAEDAKNVVKEAKEAAEKRAREAKEKGEETKEAAWEKAGEAKGRASEKAEEVRGCASEKAGGVKEKAEAAAEKAKEAAKETGAEAGERMSWAKEKTKEGMEAAKAKAGETLEKAKERIASNYDRENVGGGDEAAPTRDSEL